MGARRKHSAARAEGLALAGEVNRYLDRQAPWFEIKTDRAAAAKTVFTTLKAVDSLKTLFAPFLPFSSERLHWLLGFDGALFGQQEVVTYQESRRAHGADLRAGRGDRPLGGERVATGSAVA